MRIFLILTWSTANAFVGMLLSTLLRKQMRAIAIHLAQRIQVNFAVVEIGT